MKRTDIEWTGTPRPDGTLEPGLSSNPLQYRDRSGRVVWACVKHSSGCGHCYSETIANHYQRGKPFTRANMEDLKSFLDEKELKHILTAQKIDRRPVAGSRCFLGDMTDVFGEWVSDELLDRLFAAIALRGDVTFQVLTKRADRMAAYMQRLAKSIGPLEAAARAMGRTFKFRSLEGKECSTLPFPIPNLWLGVSAENQAAADERVPHLLATPAAVRFLSCEPLLSAVNLKPYLPHKFNREPHCEWCEDCIPISPGEDWWKHTRADKHGPFVNWVIVGGESGPGARPMQLEWARAIVRQCRAAGVACFVKQMGSNPCEDSAADPHATDVPGRVPLKLNDRKGGTPEEWPADLRVREFPPVSA